jgi:hypothetical protein
VNFFCIEQYPFSQCGFAGIDVRTDAYVSHPFDTRIHLFTILVNPLCLIWGD